MEEGNLFDLADEIEEEDRSEEQRKILLQAMQTLKAPDMILIEMRFFEQRSFRDIADILGITESNAKVKTYRILERLKGAMVKINPASSD